MAIGSRSLKLSAPSSQRRRALARKQAKQENITYFWTSDKQPEVCQGFIDLNVQIGAVSSSGRHYAAITDSGRLLMWGNGTSGQLGNGDKSNSDKPIFVEFFNDIEVVDVQCASAQSAAITKDGKLYLWGWSGEEPVFTPEIIREFETKHVTTVSLGAYHVMVMVDNANQRSSVYTWGNNDKGQLGNGTTTASKTPIEVEALGDKFVADICASETSSGIITNTGTVWVWGNNTGGIMLGINCSAEVVTLPTEITELFGIPVVQLDFGIEFGAVLSNTGNVYTWGKNSQGQLGVGDRANRTIPDVVPDLQNKFIIGISCGTKSMMAWSHTEIFSWGANNRNQLGHPEIKEIPYLCQPKLIKSFPASTIFHNASCGNGSLALVGKAKIHVTYKDKHFEESVEDNRTVGDLKTFLAPFWSLDAGSVVMKDADGQLLNQQILLRELVITSRHELTMLLKSDVQIDDEDDMKFLFDESDVPTVKLGSVQQLIRWLINPRYPNDEFLQSFLLTYRMFMTPTVLLETLIKSYSEMPSDSKKAKDPQKFKFFQLQQLRIVEVLRNWLLEHQSDFFSSKPESVQLLTNLHRFIDEIIALQDRSLAFELTRLYHQMDPSKHSNEVCLKFAPESMKRVRSGELSFNSYPIKELARQMCLISHEMFAAIEPRELIGQGWTKPDKLTRAPNIIKMIHHSNQVSNWVSQTILSQSSTKKKIRKYEKFVDLCLECMDLKNYNTLMEIIGGLQSNSLLKFSKNWPNFTAATNPYVDKVEKISKMLISRNKSELRQKLKFSTLPAVPFLGMFLQDLLFLEDGNKDQIDGLINFRKCSMIASTIKEIQRFQKVPYAFHPVKELKFFLMIQPDGNENENLNEAEPAVAQLAFLNNTSSILTDRKKTTDLQGERAAMWMQWCEKIDNDKIVYSNEDSSTRTFLEILLESFAIENSLFSVLMLFPKSDFELKLLRRLIELCFIPEISVDDLMDILDLSRKIKLPANLRAVFAQAICTFKNIVPHASAYPNISRYVDDLKNSSNQDEPDELSALRGKRKKCNRAAVKLCKTATMMISSNDHMEVFPLLYRGLHPNHLLELRNYAVSQQEVISGELEDLQKRRVSVLPLTGEVNETVRQLEHDKRQLDTSIKEMSRREEEIEQESNYFIGEIDKLSAKQSRYYDELSASIEKQNLKLERLAAVENMVVHVISLTEAKQENSEQSLENDLGRSVNMLNSYLEKQLTSLGMVETKLDTIAKDIKVMGARYGAAVTKALELDYEKTKQCFAMSLQHLDFSFATLKDSLELATALSESSPTKKKLRHSIKLKKSVEEARDKIIDVHVSEKK